MGAGHWLWVPLVLLVSEPLAWDTFSPAGLPVTQVCHPAYSPLSWPRPLQHSSWAGPLQISSLL